MACTNVAWEDSPECLAVSDYLEYKTGLTSDIFWDAIDDVESRKEFKKRALLWIDDVELEVGEMRRLIESIPKD
jgi:hypothetical protein